MSSFPRGALYRAVFARSTVGRRHYSFDPFAPNEASLTIYLDMRMHTSRYLKKLFDLPMAFLNRKVVLGSGKFLKYRKMCVSRQTLAPRGSPRRSFDADRSLAVRQGRLERARISSSSSSCGSAHMQASPCYSERHGERAQQRGAQRPPPAGA